MIIHRCPRCGRSFDSPSVCISRDDDAPGVLTEPIEIPDEEA